MDIYNTLNLYSMRDNLAAIETISENVRIDDGNARGMASLIAGIVKTAIEEMIEKEENAKGKGK